MRELKFKAWDKELKRWADNTDRLAITLNSNIVSIEQFGKSVKNVTDRYIPVQFIEAYDLNEKEIYHGDIVQHKDRPEFSGLVMFARGSAFAIGKTKTDGRQEVWSGAFMERHCVVIGNAYENPELMDWFKAAPVAEEPTPPKKKSRKKH